MHQMMQEEPVNACGHQHIKNQSTARPIIDVSRKGAPPSMLYGFEYEEERHEQIALIGKIAEELECRKIRARALKIVQQKINR